ncbi:PREDICTED: NAD(P)H-quinone oxidoreductase subunit O, chloroplastic-like [Erythranthe guttata]|uniref:NAD(P)H-quinone oxidoreductase subunit O, chloroplastic-like n=1 Tax=Erythranthe guttata TaxID=4155 RepID=UPI00064D7788|nr:PREDICTED: NAD(P)H-quinone oxidoreductase subunit O, chloroplastic-like [Erythranthe guttata]|eukprot:XP_012828847.1 PREDICTED: NAD(P)H-quinone oxidoreductase subunit O, chloroplastic-like [Erythranthe guttata]
MKMEKTRGMKTVVFPYIFTFFFRAVKKGQIVRVEKEKYLNSVNYLSVGHPPYYKGLDYIYEDRGEVLDLRVFETGEYALIAWVGIPTAPAWLPTDMLIKSDKLDYERI